MARWDGQARGDRVRLSDQDRPRQTLSDADVLRAFGIDETT
jgi:hypothetical protein